jgi:hypothetical protein
MQGRTANHSKFYRLILNLFIVLISTVKNNPGPGTYEPKTSMNLTGHYVMSNIGNTLTPSMSLPSLDKGR